MVEQELSPHRGQWTARTASFLRDNTIFFATVGVAGYVVIRGQVYGYQQTQLPFLINLLIAVLGLNAVDSIIERNTRSAKMSRGMINLQHGTAEVRRELTGLHEQLVSARLILDGLSINAVASQFLREDASIPRDRLRRARTIYWSGVTLQSSLRQHLPDLGSALAHGASLHVLVLDPGSRELRKELAVREKAKAEYVDGVLKSMLLNLQILASGLALGNSYRLGFHQIFPTYGLTIIDPEDADGVCIIDIYHPDRRHCSAFSVHATTDAAWFSFFVSQFRALMDTCTAHVIWSPEDVEDAVSRK